MLEPARGHRPVRRPRPRHIPQLFMRRRRLNETRESLELWDAYNIWTWIHADGAWTFADATPHNATDPNGQPVCPAIRFTNQIDLEGRTPGEVEPYIALANRLNKDNYDRMLAQHYNSWRVRTATGLDMTELSDAQREDRKAKLAQEDILAGGPDVKFGTLPETSLDNLVNARQADVEELAAVSQTPPPRSARWSTSATRASRNPRRLLRETQRAPQVVRRRPPRRAAPRRRHRRPHRRRGQLRPDPLWEDTDTRTVSQAVDALGKASKMLGVPQEELWDMIPGVTKTRADSWRAWKENHPDADALAVQAYASQLAPATTGGDDGLDR
ncbi:MAG: phage portal protein [Bifidobacterium bifidum]